MPYDVFSNADIVNDKDALNPDPGTEKDFEVENNPFAFSVGELTKMINPKSLAAFYALGGLAGLEKGLRTNRYSLVTVEKKCMDIVSQQTQTPTKLSEEQRQALIALRRTLLNEHHFHRAIPGEYSRNPNKLSHPFKSSTVSTIRSTTRSFLPITTNGRTLNALPDTGSLHNIMTEAEARALCLDIDRSIGNQQDFRTALGKSFHSVGSTTLSFTLNDDLNKIYTEKFAVLAQCPVPLLIGAPFLRLTETMTRFRKRLRRMNHHIANMCRLMYTDLPRSRLGCSIDSDFIFAVVDTGAERDFVSSKYATLRGWEIDNLDSGEGFVELADGSITKACGYVDTWLAIRGRTARRRFYVLNDLQCDLLLGDETIDDTDLFNKHSDSFYNLDIDDNDGDIFAIKWIEIENRIEALLQDPTFVVPDIPEASFINRIAHDGKMKKFRRIIGSKNDINHTRAVLRSVLWRTIEKLDNIESDARRRVEDELRCLSDQTLQQLQDADKNRRQEFMKRRNRIVQQLTNLDKWP